jgi:hypothetical protein
MGGISPEANQATPMPCLMFRFDGLDWALQRLQRWVEEKPTSILFDLLHSTTTTLVDLNGNNSVFQPIPLF